MTFPPSGGTKQLTLTSDQSWYALYDGNVLSVSPDYGNSGTTIVNVTITGPITSPITDYINFQNDGGYIEVDVYGVTSVTPIHLMNSSLDFPYNQDYFNEYVTSNLEWTATASDSWIQVPTAGTGSATFPIGVSANSSTSGRSGSILLTDDAGNTFGCDIEQAGYVDPISIMPISMTFAASGGSIPLYVTYDGYWTATRSATYVTVSPSFGTGSTMITLSVEPNTGNARSFTVTFTDDDFNDATFSGLQAQTETPSITLSPTSSSLNWDTQMAQYTITKTGPVGTLSATFSGDTSVIDTYSLGASYINVYTNNNTDPADKQVTVTVTDGVTSGSASLTKKGASSGIGIYPARTTVSNNSGSTSFTIAPNFMSTVGASATGSMVILSTTLSGNTIDVTYGTNTGATNLYGYINVSGVDNWGTTRTNQAIITQTPAAGTISISPSSRTIGATTSTTTYNVSTTGSVGTLEVSFLGDVSVSTYSLTGGVLTVNTNDNNTAVAQQSTIVVSDGVVSASATLTKSAATASLSVSPTTATVGYAPGSTAFTVSSSMMATLNASATGSMNITSTSISNGTLTVVYGANTGTSNKTGYVTVNGIDTLGNPHSETVTITQTYDSSSSSLTITPASKTVSASSGSTTFAVTSSGLHNIGIQGYTGSMNITGCTYSNGTVTVNYGTNSSSSQKDCTIVVEGYDTNNLAVVAMATLTQSASVSNYTFEFNPSSQSSKTISAASQTVSYTITSLLNGSPVGWSMTSNNSSWLLVNNNSVSVSVNSASSSRTGTITFTQYGSGMTLTGTIIQQGQSIVYANNPIWRDYTISSNSGFLEYHIYESGNLIYGGKAYAYPNSNIQFTVNDVVSNYLGNGILFQAGVHQIPDYAKMFAIQTTDGISYSAGFYNSWAYEESNILSEPISTRVDPRQWLPYSWLNGSITANGQSYSGSGGVTLMLDLDSFGCGETLNVNGTTYYVCEGDYVLYYANRFGGWDALLCNATSKKTDNINRFNYRKIDGQKVNYKTVVTPTWTMKTFQMFGNEGERMRNLMESNYIYLHILKTNEIVPVVITNSNCDYLNNRNSKRPYAYDITVEESYNKIRK